MNSALEGGWISSRGEFINKFEQIFAEVMGANYALAVTNGTAALHLALTTIGISQGDEVIVPNFCMIAPIFAVLYCGAKPVPVDCDHTWNMDPLLIEEKISPRTRAILVVHTYGHPADMETIYAIARRHGLYLIEDVAEALGATVNGRKAGSYGDIACFSFYANKIITTGEGGMVTLQDQQLYAKARWKRDMCFGQENEDRFIHQDIGYNYRMTNLAAALGVAQINHLDKAIEAKINIAKWYSSFLQGVRGLRLPEESPWAKNVYWVYGIVLEKEFGLSRPSLMKLLHVAGIDTRTFFHAIHLQPVLRELRIEGKFPNSVYLSDNGLYIPSYVGMAEATALRVAETIRHIQKRV